VKHRNLWVPLDMRFIPRHDQFDEVLVIYHQ
jgi:hypothetical protein